MLVKQSNTKIEIASYLLTGLALLVILLNGLLVALFAGLLVHSLVGMLTPLLGARVGRGRAKLVAVSTLGVFIVTALTLGVWGTITFFQSDAGSAGALMQKLADIIDASRAQCPEWVCSHIPDNAEELRETLSAWMREHAHEAKTLSENAGHTIVRILLGMVIGAMVSLHETTNGKARQPLAAALTARASTLSRAFKKIVFAQARISAVNTTFTAIYVLIVLPLAGVNLPLSKSLILITFVAGLLPIIGNLISNTILVIIALPFGLSVSLASLVFLIVLHKLEYFLNAKIIGTEIKAEAWELLIAMLVMESVFGLTGVVAAPVLYSYLKQELLHKQLI